MRDNSTNQFQCTTFLKLESHYNESFGKVLFGLAQHLPEGLNIALLGKSLLEEFKFLPLKQFDWFFLKGQKGGSFQCKSKVYLFYL